MRIFCRIFGHKWDKTEKYRQECKRCLAVRYRVVDKIKHAYGEKAIHWTVLDIGSLKIK